MGNDSITFKKFGYVDYPLTDAITLRVDYINPIKEGTEIFRIDIHFIENRSDKHLRPLWYEIWVNQELVEDKLKLEHGATDRDFIKFATDFIEKRYKENNNVLPNEFGAILFSDRTEKLCQSRDEMWTWYNDFIKNQQVNNST